MQRHKQITNGIIESRTGEVFQPLGLQSEGRRRKIDLYGTARQLPALYSMGHDVLVVDCDYWSSDMRVVRQPPVRAAECRLFRR